MPTALILGAGGFIGGADAKHSYCMFYDQRRFSGSVLYALHQSNPTFTFKALVRSPSSLDGFKSAGVPISAVEGTFTDLELIKQTVADVDVVVNAADSDTLPLHKAILAGMKKRFDEGRGRGLLVHISGGAVFGDGKKDGKANPEGKVWTVNNILYHEDDGLLRRASLGRCGRREADHTADGTRNRR